MQSDRRGMKPLEQKEKQLLSCGEVTKTIQNKQTDETVHSVESVGSSNFQVLPDFKSSQ